MTNSLMKWHLARDSREQLAKFCAKHRTHQETRKNTYDDGTHKYFEITYHFDNGSWITAELWHGDSRSYSVADHFQVTDYQFAQ